MEFSDLSTLYELSARRTRGISLKFRRHLADRIDWENRLISLRGARGTGKTTLLLQRMKTALPDPQQAVYLSLDHLWFRAHSVYDAVEAHVQNGGTHVFLDEVHYQEHWETLIKNLYDDFPGLHIVYTGSSGATFARLVREKAGVALLLDTVAQSLVGDGLHIRRLSRQIRGDFCFVCAEGRQHEMAMQKLRNLLIQRGGVW